MITRETVVEKTPDRKRVVFITSDGKRHDWEQSAELHERYLAAKLHVKTLKQRDDWTLVRSMEDAAAVFLSKSEGMHNGKDYLPYEFPAWMSLEIHQNDNRYWIVDCKTLYFGDLEEMLEGLRN